MSALIPRVPHHLGLYITTLIYETTGYVITAFLRLDGMEWLSEVVVPLLAKLAQS